MSAELHVHADRPPVSWDEFRNTHPPGSIALDGYVDGGPQYDEVGPFLNIDHHGGVDRLATYSTGGQVLVKMVMGMDEPFKSDEVFSPHVYVNDCDQDVCTAWYLLKHVEEAKKPSPALEHFVYVEDKLDVTAGAYPVDLKTLGQLAWVFEPYTTFRASGEMAQNVNTQYREVIEGVEVRIGQHLAGEGRSVVVDTRYNVIGGGQDWRMIEEVGEYGKIGALRDGVNAYVVVQELPNDTRRYVVGRRSEFIPFPLQDIVKQCNKAEGRTDALDRWGGSPVIIGSPRVSGSLLHPQKVEEIINGLPR